MCVIKTSRISYTGLDGINTTIGSGKGVGLLLAPMKEMVYGHKAGRGDSRFVGRYTPLTDAEYTERYYELIRGRYVQNTAAFVELLHRPSITIMCYCKSGDFCHRHLAVDILKKIADWFDIPVEIKGEI